MVYGYSDRLNHLHFIIISLSKLPTLNRQHFLLKYCSVEINCIKAVFFTALSTAFDVVSLRSVSGAGLHILSAQQESKVAT